ncbi:MAG TPA: amidase [Steroidobacteraceae bacterium]|nr:amidase [Steroidobacteraceae bacterium]
MSAAQICLLSACELAGRIRRRELSALEVMSAHIDRIERVNPALNAIVTFLPDRGLDAARALDAALARGAGAGPLAGLPIAHKDLVPTRGVRTTSGSLIFKDFIPDTDALIVERLRAAGAVMIGKTNTPEFGAGSQTFNAVFGATRNPYDLGRTCGGSSGGAAAALAAGLLPIADGSDLGGSLRNPASFCNVVGLRPSAGRVPNWPTQSAWFDMAVLGPMARTVADAALLLSVMAGPDARDPLCLQEPGAIFARPLERDFNGARIAWSSDLGGLPMEPEVRRILDAQRRIFTDLGCIVEEATPDLRDADEIFRVLRAWHFDVSLGALLRSHRGSMKDTVIWNIEQGAQLTGAQVGAAEIKRTQLFHRMREFMARYDFLVAPVVQVLPFDVAMPYPTRIDGVELDTYLDWMRSCYYISATGAPAASVPCGFSAAGLPVGLQIIGGHRQDFLVLQMAFAFEQATRMYERRPALVDDPRPPGASGALRT